MRKILLAWIPLALAVTGLAALSYIGIQQNYRASLNDPQIQITEDAAAKLERGLRPDEIVPDGAIDISKSLAPFIAVYRADGQVFVAHAMLENSPPQPPRGIFEYAKTHGSDRVTWQPAPDTRIALVVRYVEKADLFVLSGRNMREGESRILQIGRTIFIGWLGTLLGLFPAVAVVQRLRNRTSQRE